MSMRSMRLLIIGAPGAGKGTQAEYIKSHYKIPHISTGEMFRKVIAANTELGDLAKVYIDRGDLVPDSATNTIVKARLSERDCKRGFLLDGYPRNLSQVKAFEGMLDEHGWKLDAVINIDVPVDIIVRRIIGRRMCKNCGKLYHIETMASKIEGVCDICGGSLQQRKDDLEETVRHRLKVYNSQTKPILEHYLAQGLVHTFDGQGDPKDIFQKVMEFLGE
jgi:adenylate kinase